MAPVAAPTPPMATFGGAFGGAIAGPFQAHALPTVAMTNDFLAAVANSGATPQLAGGDFEDNFLLKRKIEELKKQMTSLIATNEVLLEQNAHYRHHVVPKLCNVAITNAPPIVTVSQVVTPTITLAPADARHQTPLMTPIATAPLNAMSLLYASHGQAANEMLALNQAQVQSQHANAVVAAGQAAQQQQQPAQPTVTLSQPAALKMAPQAASNVISVPVSLIDNQVAAPAADLRHQRQQVAVAATRNAVAASVVNALAQTSLSHCVPTASISGAHQAAPSALVSYPVISHAAVGHSARALSHLPTSGLTVGCIQPSA